MQRSRGVIPGGMDWSVIGYCQSKIKWMKGYLAASGRGVGMDDHRMRVALARIRRTNCAHAALAESLSQAS
jgi:hypothetical protein